MPFVPAPRPALRFAREKLPQLSLAASLGLEIPPTLVTTEPGELLDFYSDNGGRIITKLLDQDSMADSGLTGQFMRYTEVHDLPAAIADKCLGLTKALGLRYGACDLVLTPDGRYVFLELNPAGEFHWIEQVTGLPITAAIVDLLVELSGAVSGGTSR